MKRLFSRISFILIFLVLFSCTQQHNDYRNIIFFIGDGMGPVQIEVAGLYGYGTSGTLSFEQFPIHTTMTTFSADNNITDSAASATAMATGQKVNNGVISQKHPGDGSDLPTILEILQKGGHSTGLVTTAEMTHATPAAFGAHEPSRSNYSEIAADYFRDSRPNLLLGGGGAGMTQTLAEIKGYEVVTNLPELLSITSQSTEYLSGQFGSGHLPYEYDGLGDLPGLSDMTSLALDFLEDQGKPFFLMVEGARIDHACHNNDLIRAIYETLELSEAVQIAYSWAKDRADTIIIVSADHETGGLSGIYPDVTWSTTYHTAIEVDVFAWGADAESILEVDDNTDFFSILLNL